MHTKVSCNNYHAPACQAHFTDCKAPIKALVGWFGELSLMGLFWFLDSLLCGSVASIRGSAFLDVGVSPLLLNAFGFVFLAFCLIVI